MEFNQLLCLYIVISTVTVSSHAAQSEFLKYFSVNATVEKSAETQWTGENKNSDVQTKYKPVVTSDVQTQYKPVVTSPKEANYKLSYANYDITWKNFKLEHKRNYASTSEEERRFAIFMDNVKTIEKHNWQFHLGQSTYWMNINQFSDWTPQEFQAMLPPMDLKTPMWAGLPKLVYEGDSDVSVPDSIDWRSKGYVTPVKDQGKCGSCYAFSTTGSIEGQWYRKTGKLIPLSEQQIVDCAGFFDDGCDGGSVFFSFLYIILKGGLESESDYPYTGKNGESCKFQTSKAVANITGIYPVFPRSEKALHSAVGTQGPVSVGIVSTENLRHYQGGIFVDSTCEGERLNHAVLAVGYGSSNGSDYWIVKNSWGTTWGDKGYVYMARNRDNMCGIASKASFPAV